MFSSILVKFLLLIPLEMEAAHCNMLVLIYILISIQRSIMSHSDQFPGRNEQGLYLWPESSGLVSKLGYHMPLQRPSGKSALKGAASAACFPAVIGLCIWSVCSAPGWQTGTITRQNKNRLADTFMGTWLHSKCPTSEFCDVTANENCKVVGVGGSGNGWMDGCFGQGNNINMLKAQQVPVCRGLRSCGLQGPVPSTHSKCRQS